MGTRVAEVRSPPKATQSIPTTGMRGGLGRTLLTAFLILTILPLALIGGYVAQYYRLNLQEEVKSKLQAVATLKGEELHQWFAHIQQLSFVVDGGTSVNNRAAWWLAVHNQEPNLIGAFFFDQVGSRQWAVGSCPDTRVTTALGKGYSMFLAIPGGTEGFSPGWFFSSPIDFQTWLSGGGDAQETLVFCLSASAVDRFIHYDVLTDQALIGSTGKVHLVSESRIWPGDEKPVFDVTASAQSPLPNEGLYINHLGVPVIGAHYYLDEFGVGLLVEQEQAETLKSSDRIAATVIALVLAVALATTAISAVVIRQITRPVIQLTELAVAMAEGDLDQHLAVTSRDEIGILTYVFNEMAADLKSLYDDLEAKVAERTQKLQQANYQIQRRALHLQASQEVGQAITSARDTQLLLNRVVDLIRDSFVYTSVAIYIVEPGGGEIRLRALSPGAPDADEQNLWDTRVYAGDGSIIERAVRKRELQIEQQETNEAVEWYRRTLSRVAIPLRMGKQVLGVMAMLSIEREEVQREELEILELLAGQVAVALENVKAYERERLATQQLEEAEVYKARFLANMSHELREPLNTIIGFSRLMIKGIDGPMTELQVQDLERIYSDGQRLLFLVNDILVISQIQAGMMELALEPVQLEEIIAGVMPTASALVRDKDVELIQDVPEDLPLVRADPGRVRQILVHLFNNAAKFTESGQIVIRSWCNEDQVYTSVSDTGMGIPPEDRDRIFVRFAKGMGSEEHFQNGAGLGLALCKEFVEMHGGQIWVNSEVDQGSMFTFSLPCYTD